MNQRQWREHDQLRADQAVIREVAGRLRDPEHSPELTTTDDLDRGEALAGLFEHLADELATLPGQVREHTARVSRDLTGTPMDRPSVRRTRR